MQPPVIALTQNGRLVFARGYGLAAQQNHILVQPDSLFRIASLSRAITAVTMHLLEAGQLSLDQPAFAILSDLQPSTGATMDPRLDSIDSATPTHSS